EAVLDGVRPSAEVAGPRNTMVEEPDYLTRRLESGLGQRREVLPIEAEWEIDGERTDDDARVQRGAGRDRALDGDRTAEPGDPLCETSQQNCARCDADADRDTIKDCGVCRRPGREGSEQTRAFGRVTGGRRRSAYRKGDVIPLPGQDRGEVGGNPM